MDESGKATLLDFGMALIQPDQASLQPLSGTPIYQPPEKLNKAAHDWRKGDIWALGVCIYRTVLVKFPFTGASERELYTKIKKASATYPPTISDALKKLLTNLLEVDHLKRPAADDLLTFDWFSNCNAQSSSSL